jgi:hypothetical protein
MGRPRSSISMNCHRRVYHRLWKKVEKVGCPLFVPVLSPVPVDGPVILLSGSVICNALQRKRVKL